MNEPTIKAGRLILPAGMTEDQAREWIEAEIAESHANDSRSLQVLGAYMVREHATICKLEDALRAGPGGSITVEAHHIAEVSKLLTNIRHEVGRAKGHLSNRASIRNRWQEKLAKLGGQER